MWDLFITFCILFTCCSTPVYVAFTRETDSSDLWYIVNFTVDFIFGIDIVVIFFSAFYDSDFQLVDNLKDIARNYLTGWFLIDLLAIIPFEEFSKSEMDSHGNVN